MPVLNWLEISCTTQHGEVSEVQLAGAVDGKPFWITRPAGILLSEPGEQPLRIDGAALLRRLAAN